MHFSDYLKTFQTSSSPEGDLSRDFIESRSKAKTYKGILKSLRDHGADKRVIEVLERLHLSYSLNRMEGKHEAD